MTQPYRSSMPGKLMILAMGFYFLGLGLRGLLEPGLGLRVFVLCTCVTICAVIVSVPFGMLKHVGQTIFVVCVVPFLVWAGFPAARVLMEDGSTTLTNILVGAGALAIIAALIPGKAKAG